jgi:hypothetical protein
MVPVWCTVKGVGDDMSYGAGVREMEGSLSMVLVDALATASGLGSVRSRKRM